MIDQLVASIPEAERGFRLLFSATPFPGHTVKLEWRREESGGNWYYCPQFDIEGWLCPALSVFRPGSRGIVCSRRAEEQMRMTWANSALSRTAVLGIFIVMSIITSSASATSRSGGLWLSSES